MCLQKIHHIIGSLKLERYRWDTRSPDGNPEGKWEDATAGIPTWSDKLLQEVLRSILEPYYEQRFSPHSHGFRPKRGCHSALLEIRTKWKGTVWFIEGDIKGCFNNIDHTFQMNTWTSAAPRADSRSERSGLFVPDALNCSSRVQSPLLLRSSRLRAQSAFEIANSLPVNAGTPSSAMSHRAIRILALKFSQSSKQTARTRHFGCTCRLRHLVGHSCQPTRRRPRGVPSQHRNAITYRV